MSTIPSLIKFHSKSQTLELAWNNSPGVSLSAELLRVLSPSAEVRGHGVGNEVLQVGKLFLNSHVNYNLRLGRSSVPRKRL